MSETSAPLLTMEVVGNGKGLTVYKDGDVDNSGRSSEIGNQHDVRKPGSSKIREVNRRPGLGKEQQFQQSSEEDQASKTPGSGNKVQVGGANHPAKDFKSISIDIPNILNPKSSDHQVRGERIASLILFLRNTYSVEITSSINLSTATLSVIIRGPSDNVEKARTALVKNTSPKFTRYLYLDPGLVPPIMRRFHSDSSEVQVSLYGNGDPTTVFPYSEIPGLNHTDLLYEGDDPAFSIPKSPFEGKPLLVITGIQEDICNVWKYIQDLAKNTLPNRYASVELDRSLILFISLDGTTSHFLSLFKDKGSIINFNNTELTVQIPSFFPVSPKQSSAITFFGPTQAVNSAVKLLNESIATLLESTLSIQINLNKRFHRTLAGDNCSNIPYLFISTGCAIVFPPYASNANYVIARARSMKEIENAKFLINGIASNSRTSFYDLDLTSLNINLPTIEGIIHYINCCRPPEISKLEEKYNCKVVQVISDSLEPHWSKMISIETGDAGCADEPLSELQKFIQVLLRTTSFEQFHVPFAILSKLYPNPTVPYFVSASSILGNKTPIKGILFFPHLSNTPFVSSNLYKSKNFSQKICIIFNHAPSSKNPKSQTINTSEVEAALVQLFTSLKSNSGLSFCFYAIPPTINPKFYAKIINTSIIPFLKEMSIPYSLEYPKIDDATVDFIGQNNLSITKTALGPTVVFCAPNDMLSSIRSTVNDLFLSWSDVVSRRSVSNSIHIPKGTTYSFLFTNNRKREAEISGISELACERLGCKVNSEDGSRLSSETTKIEQLFHNFYIRLVRPNSNQKTASQLDSDTLVINGCKDVVDVVSEIVKERILLQGDKTRVRISILPKLSEDSRQILSSNGRGVSLLNRIILGASSPIRTILQDARKDEKLKIGFNGLAEPSNGESIDSLPDNTYILWADGSATEIDFTVDKIIRAINNEISKHYTVQLTVQKITLPQAVSMCSQEINEIKKKFDVIISRSENKTSGLNSKMVSIRIAGHKKAVESAKESYMKIHHKYSAFCEKKIYIPRYMHGNITRHQREKIRSIISSLGTEKEIFISITPDPKTANYDYKLPYYTDAITISSFEQTLHKIIEGLVDATVNKNDLLRKLVKFAIYHEDPQELEGSSVDGILMRSIVLPSSMDHNQYSSLVSKLRSYANTLDNAIIRSFLLPIDEIDSLKLENFDKLRQELSQPEVSESASDLLRLFVPAVKYTIFSNKEESLIEIEKSLINRSPILSCYDFTDDERSLCFECDSGDSGFTPALDFLMESLSRLEVYLHLGFQIRFSEDQHPCKIMFCTLPIWQDKLKNALSEIFTQLRSFNYFRAIIIQISEPDHIEGKKEKMECYNREVYVNLKRQIEDIAKAQGVHLFDLQNFPCEYDCKFVKLYLGGGSLDAINHIVQEVKQACTLKTRFNYDLSDSVSNINAKVTLSKILATGRLPSEHEVHQNNNTHIPQTSKQPFTSHFSINNFTPGLIIHLSPFTNGEPHLSSMPVVSKSTTPVIDCGMSTRKSDYKPELKPSRELLTKSNPTKKSEQIQSLNINSNIQTPTTQTYQHTPEKCSNTNSKSGDSPHITSSNSKLPQSNVPSRNAQTLITPQEANKNFSISKHPERKVNLVYKKVTTGTEHVQSKESTSPFLIIKAGNNVNTSTLSVSSTLNNMPPISQLRFGHDSDSDYDDVDDTKSENDGLSCEDNVNNEQDYTQYNASGVEDINLGEGYKHDENEDYSDEIEDCLSPKSALSSISSVSNHHSPTYDKRSTELDHFQSSNGSSSLVDYIDDNTCYQPQKATHPIPHQQKAPHTISTPHNNEPTSEWKKVSNKRNGIIYNKPTVTIKPQPKPIKRDQNHREDNTYFLTNEEAEHVGSDAPVTQTTSQKKNRKRRKKKKSTSTITEQQ